MRPSYFNLDSFGRRVEFLTIASTNSPRGAKRKLKLRSNPHRFLTAKRTLLKEYDDFRMPDYLGSGLGLPSLDYTDSSLYNKAYSSFVSKLHKGDASLGVTLGSWRQSRDMIANRLGQIVGFLKGIRDTPENRRKWKERERKRIRRARDNSPLSAKKAAGDASSLVANSHLEWIFGWVPLVSDIYSAMEVLTGPVAPVYAGGTGKDFTEGTYVYQLYPGTAKTIITQKRRCRLAANVQITNPNLWLANRLGLINPAVVAWDLIPWSFVVGMFANISQMIKSVTAFVGLAITDVSTTWSSVGYTDYVVENPNYPGKRATMRALFRLKRRTLSGTIPYPSLQFRVPDMSWGTVAMFASLAVQQVSRISKIFK